MPEWLAFWVVFGACVFGGPLLMLWLVRRTENACPLCRDGYPRMERVDLTQIPEDWAAIACTTRGYGHAAPRERCEEIVQAARAECDGRAADILIRMTGCVPPRERAA